jgi:predicted ATPase
MLENQAIKSFINDSLQLLEIGEDIQITRHEGVMSIPEIRKGGTNYNLADLGFGYSQFLPILMQIALAAHKNYSGSSGKGQASFHPSLLLIEEPEANLHPKLHTRLADFFVAASQQLNIQFILESHSEYLIRKLQLLVAKKKITLEDISILYFNEKPEDGEKIRRITIQPDGRLSQPFGPGFYDESIELMLMMLKHQQKEN